MFSVCLSFLRLRLQSEIKPSEVEPTVFGSEVFVSSSWFGFSSSIPPVCGCSVQKCSVRKCSGQKCWNQATSKLISSNQVSSNAASRCVRLGEFSVDPSLLFLRLQLRLRIGPEALFVRRAFCSDHPFVLLCAVCCLFVSVLGG